MAITALNAEIRVASTGEVTTIAKLADAGRIRFSVCTMTTRKRQGERHDVVRYFADLIEDRADGIISGWQIGKTAYESRTTGKPSIAEVK